MNNTKLNFLEDTYLGNKTALIVEIGSDDKGSYIISDETIFYPQGGGQPFDTGKLIHDNGEIQIIDVRYDDGKVKHYTGNILGLFPVEGSYVEMNVNMERRLLNAKYHTAGHLLSNILEGIASEDSVVAVKGHQFPEGANVEFNNISKRAISDDIETINKELSEAINKNLNIVVRDGNYEEIQKSHPHLAPYIPTDKPSRIVQIGDYPPYPCGGTHISSLSEVGQIKVTKAKNKKDNTKISYTLDI